MKRIRPAGRTCKYDYYNVNVPEDITDRGDREFIAITTARENARIYATPCDWRVMSDNGVTVRVRRRRPMARQ